MELTLQEKIQLLRKRTGMNQGQFGAKAFKLTEETGRTKIKNIELGKQKPSADDLAQMAKLLNLPVSALMPKADDLTIGPMSSNGGMVVEQAVIERFRQLGPYLEMLNRAVAIKDEELIAHIAEKLSGIFLFSTRLKAVND